MERLRLNQVAIVTGGGQGVGEQVAQALGLAGFRVAVADLNPDRVERVAAQIREQGGQAMGMTMDVGSKFQCVMLVEAVREQWGRLDLLVNSAGISPTAPILKMDEWDWQRCFDYNLKGIFFMCQLVGRVMSEENGQQGGVMVNLVVGVGEAVYQAAKQATNAGIVAFSQSCALEFAPHHIAVHALEVDPTDFSSIPTQILQLCSTK